MLTLNLEGRILFLKPCPFYYFPQYNFYLSCLQGLKIGDIAASDYHWGILQSLVNLHPRGDIDGKGFKLPDDYEIIKNLIEKLEALNTIDPLPPGKKPQNYLEVAPKSSGDPAVDILSDLSDLLGYEAAIAITKEMGLNAINKFIARHNETNRPREDRAQELMQDDLKSWAAEDGDQWFSDLGINQE